MGSGFRLGVQSFMADIRPGLLEVVHGKTFKAWRCDQKLRDLMVGEDREILQFLNQLQLPAFTTSKAPNDVSVPNFLLEGLEGAVQDEERKTRYEKIFCSTKHSFVLNTSGSGKTRALLEALAQQWGLYFICREENGLASADLAMAITHTLPTTPGFTPELPKGPDRGTLLANNQRIASHVLSIVLLARLLLFKEFLMLVQAEQRSPQAPKDPRVYIKRWLDLQVQPWILDSRYGSDVFQSLSDVIRRFSVPDTEVDESIRTITVEVLSMTKEITVNCDSIFLLVDEAQEAARQLPLAFESSAEDNQSRPILREMIHVWAKKLSPNNNIESCPLGFVVTGTGLSSEELTVALSSSVMKGGPFAEFNKIGGFDCVTDQVQYVSKYVPQRILTHRIGKTLLCRMWHWFRGRYRFTAEFLCVLLTNGYRRPNELMNQYIYKFADFFPMDCPQSILDEEAALWPFPHYSYEPRITYTSLPFALLLAVTDVLRQPFVDDLDPVGHALEDVINITYTYFLKSQLTHCKGSTETKLVEYGFARIPSIASHQISYTDIRPPVGRFNRKPNTPVVNENLVLCTSAVWLNKHSKSFYRWICGDIEKVISGEGQSCFENLIAYYFLLAFGTGSEHKLEDIFDFYSTGQEGLNVLKGKVATMMSLYIPSTHGDSSALPESMHDHCGVHLDDTGHISGCAGPLGLNIIPSCRTLLMNWLGPQARQMLCFPDVDMGPDIMFKLRLESDGEEPTYIWVAVQVKLIGKGGSISKETLRDAIRSVTPSKFYVDLPNWSPDPVERAKRVQKTTQSRNQYKLNSETLAKLKQLENADQNAGKYSLLRVVATYPDVTDFTLFHPSEPLMTRQRSNILSIVLDDPDDFEMPISDDEEDQCEEGMFIGDFDDEEVNGDDCHPNTPWWEDLFRAEAAVMDTDSEDMDMEVDTPYFDPHEIDPDVFDGKHPLACLRLDKMSDMMKNLNPRLVLEGYRDAKNMNVMNVDDATESQMETILDRLSREKDIKL
ncbi:hypothetical protein VNI00_003714 [Paramarasmius palmivorus]|uniref:Uncharacterized protein n=1 Tax=Paramarasmius palmivorus TaxID=297713 RepID=A0AAW0DU68_9AGAR